MYQEIDCKKTRQYDHLCSTTLVAGLPAAQGESVIFTVQKPGLRSDMLQHTKYHPNFMTKQLDYNHLYNIFVVVKFSLIWWLFIQSQP